MENAKEILKSICTSDKEVKEVVKSIRRDILPNFEFATVVGEKILVRKIFTKENEKTEGGVIILERHDKTIAPENLYSTHPFQAVIVGIQHRILKEDSFIGQLEVGDHILCTREIPSDLSRGGVIVNGYIFAYLHTSDIICVVSSYTEPIPYKVEE